MPPLSTGAIAQAGSDSVAVADSVTAATPASPAVLDDSTFTALSHAFRHQTVAAVYYDGRRYEVANPKIRRKGSRIDASPSPPSSRPAWFRLRSRGPTWTRCCCVA